MLVECHLRLNMQSTLAAREGFLYLFQQKPLSLSLSLSLSRHLVLTGLTKNAGAWQFSFLRCDYSKGVTHNNFLARTKKDPAGQAERMWCNLTFSLHFLYIVKLGN